MEAACQQNGRRHDIHICALICCKKNFVTTKAYINNPNRTKEEDGNTVKFDHIPAIFFNIRFESINL